MDEDKPLSETDLDPDPLRQFARWFAEAGATVPSAEATALATATPEGAPSVRMVLLKRFDEDGLVFHTNYESRKGEELESNPRAALLFHWQPLGRQVRIEGPAERVAQEESAAYFRTRPRGAQVGARVSRQSQPIGSREELEKREAKLTLAYEGLEVPLPAWWGGYRIRPEAWEFWQHRESRLHDRFCYRPDGRGGWTVQRLQP
ncbi:MAG: pyridoxamine 5'-phosphate oxidase [Gaiellaceae bacterium]